MTYCGKSLISIPFRKFVFILLLLLVPSLSQRYSFEFSPSGIRISGPVEFAIGLEGGMYYSKGFPVGFQYEISQKFGTDANIEVIGSYCKDRDSIMNRLLLGQYDIVAIPADDSILITSSENILESVPVADAVWLVRREDYSLLSEINRWVGTITYRGSYNTIYKRYFGSYDLSEYRESLTQANSISPYDDIIKRYSSILGWDWRLLAAIIYKESRFSIVAHSVRGAQGLMQVREVTAGNYGVENLLDPDENIYAGVKFLESIQNRYIKQGLDSVNSIKFTLAAYNAGESRIADCMLFTENNGGDPTNWESVSRYIPMMSLPEYYSNADYLNHGRFNGSETINYVDNVASIYEEYSFLVKK